MNKSSVKKHYENLLAEHYSWMFGDFDWQVEANRLWFQEHNIYPHSNARAIDFGCGSGFQSLALSSMDFDVLGIDFNHQLLRELKSHDQKNEIETIKCGILDKKQYGDRAPFELATCMGDTLAHLPSMQAVSKFFGIVSDFLGPRGKFILSFRDYEEEISGIDRFIPVHQDYNKIMTVFLEYKPDYVLVHDLIYQRNGNEWEFNKSVYKKIRITNEKVIHLLKQLNFQVDNLSPQKGMIHLIATKL